MTRGGLRRIGWLAALSVIAGLLLVLAFRVNAVRSEVRAAENRIVALKREKMYLETEFETRANQQQLKAWNDIEFGYIAPSAKQYLENERELAVLGKPAGPGAPAPIRVAVAAAPGESLPAMVSPLTGKPLAEASAPASAAPLDHDEAARKLGDRLGTIAKAEATDAAPSAAAKTQR